MTTVLNRVVRGDCVAEMGRLGPESVDLAFADPPFNIGYDYDEYQDNRSEREYLDWSRQWIGGVWRVLQPQGTFWLAIGDEFAAELKVLAKDIGFSCRSWVIWYYTFGVNCVRAFSRSHTHLFHFVKDAEGFTFNAENPTVRVPSARQLVYGDRRANPRGRLPDNTWILRPQDVPDGFRPQEDTWYFPRVAGTFKEREGFHGCQMPEQLLGRIIRCCSNPADVVLDPFAGSGTTLAVAKKLGRQYLGFEMSKEYVARVRERLRAARVGDSLDGAADPLASAPATDGKKAGGRGKNGRATIGQVMKPRRLKPLTLTKDLQKGIIAAFQTTHAGHSVDRLLADPDLDKAYLDACKKSGLPGNSVDWNRMLMRVRKSGKLPRPPRQGRVLTFAQMDPYSHAAEIAMHHLAVETGAALDQVFCDPRLAKMFDEVARGYAPGFSPLEYRWAALAIRKRASQAKRRAVEKYADWLKGKRLPRRKKLTRDWSDYARTGVYIVSAEKTALYVGETLNLQARIEGLQESPAWRRVGPTSVVVLPDVETPYALQSALVARTDAIFNAAEYLCPSVDAVV